MAGNANGSSTTRELAVVGNIESRRMGASIPAAVGGVISHQRRPYANLNSIEDRRTTEVDMRHGRDSSCRFVYRSGAINGSKLQDLGRAGSCDDAVQQLIRKERSRPAAAAQMCAEKHGKPDHPSDNVQYPILAGVKRVHHGSLRRTAAVQRGSLTKKGFEGSRYKRDKGEQWQRKLAANRYTKR